jgi:fucose 4-O-acetylase-like acetyltransferase
MIVGGFLLRSVPWSLPGYANFYTTSPLYVLIRLGCVLVICALLYAWEKHLSWIPQSVRVAGQESLLVYGLHLWVIFAFLRGKHVGPLLGLEMGYARCFALSAVIILAMLGLAALWRNLKMNYPRITKRAQAITVLAMILVFVMR